MFKKNFKPDGYCGLYCAACPQFITTEKNESSKLDDNSCMGCKSNNVAKGWCIECNLKSCAKSKNIEFCYECNDYPCKDINNFQKDPIYPYHSEVFDYMKTIKEDGIKKWLQKMADRWKCSSCGQRYGWWTSICKNCGSKVNGYINPRES